MRALPPLVEAEVAIVRLGAVTFCTSMPASKQVLVEAAQKTLPKVVVVVVTFGPLVLNPLYVPVPLAKKLAGCPLVARKVSEPTTQEPGRTPFTEAEMTLVSVPVSKSVFPVVPASWSGGSAVSTPLSENASTAESIMAPLPPPSVKLTPTEPDETFVGGLKR